MPEDKRTDKGGTGQSGYTAGRTHDPALDKDIQTHHQVSPRGSDAGKPDNTDDRWRGKGGPLAPPDNSEPE